MLAEWMGSSGAILSLRLLVCLSSVCLSICLPTVCLPVVCLSACLSSACLPALPVSSSLRNLSLAGAARQQGGPPLPGHWPGRRSRHPPLTLAWAYFLLPPPSSRWPRIGSATRVTECHSPGPERVSCGRVWACVSVRVCGLLYLGGRTCLYVPLSTVLSLLYPSHGSM